MSADLVIVANRLPVDRVELANGKPGWRALARRPRDRRRAGDAGQRRHLGRLAGRHRVGAQALRPRWHAPGADELERRGDRGVLRRLLQRDDLADLPRPRGQAGVPPGVVGCLRLGQPPLRREGRRDRGQGRHGLGARLPAPAGPADAARAAARPPDRVLPAHPVPAGRAVPAAALATADPRGAARGRPGRLPDARRGRQLRAPGAAAGRPQDPPRPDLPARRPHGAGGGVPDLDRRGRFRGAGPVRAGRQARHGDPRGARQPRARSSWASTGSTTPRASTRGCAPTAS